MIKLLGLLTFVFLVSCSALPGVDGPRFTPDTMGVVVIENIAGGNVEHFLAERSKLANLGTITRIEIRGYCNSACTVLYSLPKACMTPGSRLGFHTASFDITGIYERRMREHYRNGIRDAYWTEWRHSDDIISINRTNAIELDPTIKRCENIR